LRREKERERGKGKEGNRKGTKVVPHFLNESHAAANEILLSKMNIRPLTL